MNEEVSDEYINTISNKIEEIFGDRTANPEHEPIRFNYQIKVAHYLLKPRTEKVTNEQENSGTIKESHEDTGT
jgi:hypothetical protein